MFGVSSNDRSGDILKALGRITGFLRRPDWRDQMPELLGMIGRAADADRVYIYEVLSDFEDDDVLLSEVCMWHADGVEPELREATSPLGSARDIGMMPYIDLLQKGELVALDVLLASPELRLVLFDRRGTYAALLAPIFVENRFWGILGFDDCRSPKKWKTEEIAALTTSGNMFGVLLERDGIQARSKNWETVIEENQILRGLIPICPSCKTQMKSSQFMELSEILFREHPELMEYGAKCPACEHNETV